MESSRSGSNEQYQPVVLPGRIPTAEHSLLGRSAIRAYRRPVKSVGCRLSYRQVSDWMHWQLQAKRRLPFNPSGLTRAL